MMSTAELENINSHIDNLHKEIVNIVARTNKLGEEMIEQMLIDLSDALFSDKVISILHEKYNNSADMLKYEPNDRIRYKMMKIEYEHCTREYYTLERLYKTLYGEMFSEIDNKIKETAKKISEYKLEKFGWTKKKEPI